jgi:cytoskeletal protein CcmA (bactofilin family)
MVETCVRPRPAELVGGSLVNICNSGEIEIGAEARLDGAIGSLLVVRGEAKLVWIGGT